jgi:hypothetical protein
MREMIFNDLSVQRQAESIHEIRPFLAGIARGMAGLVTAGVTGPALRMTKHWSEYRCAEDGSLWDLLSLMMRDRRQPDETRFLMRLGVKMPLLNDLASGDADRFLGCEPAAGADAGGECLVLCAHLLGVAISLPVQGAWDRDQLVVRFREMTAGLKIEDAEETIDNLAREHHAADIADRHRRHLARGLSFSDLWSKRASIFPYLAFGLDVEAQLRRLNADLTGPVMKRLNELHDAAEEWRLCKAQAPKWRSKVSPESESVMCNPGLRACRMFRSAEGELALFEWHARFGSSHRIHLRFDQSLLTIEIGYIGPHLRLA